MTMIARLETIRSEGLIPRWMGRHAVPEPLSPSDEPFEAVVTCLRAAGLRVTFEVDREADLMRRLA